METDRNRPESGIGGPRIGNVDENQEQMDKIILCWVPELGAMFIHIHCTIADDLDVSMVLVK